MRLVLRNPLFIEFCELKERKHYIPRLVHTLGLMRTIQIGDCNFVSGFCTSVAKGEIFKTLFFYQMKPHLNLMAQFIGIIVCTGLTKTKTSLKKRPPIFQE